MGYLRQPNHCCGISTSTHSCRCLSHDGLWRGMHATTLWHTRVGAALRQLFHRKGHVALHTELHLRDLSIRATILKNKMGVMSHTVICAVSSTITNFEFVCGDAENSFLQQPLPAHQSRPQRNEHLRHRACAACTDHTWVVMTIGVQGVSPWGGWPRYMSASHGSSVAGASCAGRRTVREGFVQDERLCSRRVRLGPEHYQVLPGGGKSAAKAGEVLDNYAVSQPIKPPPKISQPIKTPSCC